jgi:AcrR family transcriptional regulator
MVDPTEKKYAAPQAAHSAKQERSRETLERILASAEELLEDCEFDELTMADLAAHSDCAVGTVYARVPNKESLLLCLHERYLTDGIARSATVFEDCQDAGLEERARALCSLIVDFLAAHRGVTRAVTNYLFSRTNDDSAGNVALFRRRATAGIKQAASFLAEKVDRSVHADPQAAAEFALLAAQDVAQGRVAFGKRSGLNIQYSLAELKQRISALLLAYLQTG